MRKSLIEIKKKNLISYHLNFKQRVFVLKNFKTLFL